MAAFEWTEERVAMLRTLGADLTLSASAIALRLNAGVPRMGGRHDPQRRHRQVAPPRHRSVGGAAARLDARARPAADRHVCARRDRVGRGARADGRGRAALHLRRRARRASHIGARRVRVARPPRPAAAPKPRQFHSTLKKRAERIAAKRDVLAHAFDEARMAASARQAFGPADAPTGAEAIMAVETRRTCCWPVGDPQAKDFRFCLAVTGPGEVYCLDHALTAVAPDHRRARAARYGLPRSTTVVVCPADRRR